MSKKLRHRKVKIKELKHNPKKFKPGDKVKFIKYYPDWKSSRDKLICGIKEIGSIYYITSHSLNNGKGETCVVNLLPNQIHGYYCPSFALKKVK
jgi:hypothetical protein